MDAQYDTRDVEEHAAVAAALEQLPADHLARLAYQKHASTIELTHLIAERPDLVEGLKEAYLAGWWRVLMRSGGFKLEN